MTEQKDIAIIQWPKETSDLIDKFKEEPCPVSLQFEKTPLNVNFLTTEKDPLDVNMKMHLIPDKAIPVCIKMCEPICAKSDYTLNFKIFDRPLGSISIKGTTRVAACENKPQQICFNFSGMKENTIITYPLEYEGFTFTPLGKEFRFRYLGDPPDLIKLVFPTQGVAIHFPYSTNLVQMQVNNYAGEELTFSVFNDDVLLDEFVENISNELKTIRIQNDNINRIHITGGAYEASIVEICYQPIN
ncbi:hypothetical protein [Marinilabilia salmonicolor]|uniref:hypothetical protein n=1 Tax=Marinilabilia salmonicolor TaxID=989 RepID=UPI00029A0D73|nr:hypothetical protein [Marinilabilia salmonicolor]